MLLKVHVLLLVHIKKMNERTNEGRKEMFYLTTHSTERRKEGKKEMFYLAMHSKHFIYGYMALDIR